MAQDTSSQIYMHTMCFCMPLRLGVLLAAGFTFVTSVFYCIDTRHWEHEFRHFTGGYALGSRVAVGTVEISGVLAGLVGTIGTWYQRRSYVVTFNIWQFFRLGAWIFMYFVDVPLITHCEDWIDNIQGMTEAHGWNPLMYEIAMDGRCDGERTLFLVCSILTLTVFMYIVWGTARYQELMNRTPKHLLRVPKDLSSGAFYTHSLGERSHMMGHHGKHPEMRHGSMSEWAAPPMGGGVPPPFAVGGPPPQFGAASPLV